MHFTYIFHDCVMYICMIDELYVISCMRSDHGGEFENHAFENFCNDFGIEH